MKLTTLTALLIGVLTFTACKKENPEPKTPTTQSGTSLIEMYKGSYKGTCYHHSIWIYEEWDETVKSESMDTFSVDITMEEQDLNSFQITDLTKDIASRSYLREIDFDFTADGFAFADTVVKSGGLYWNKTVYQVHFYNEAENELFIRVHKEDHTDEFMGDTYDYVLTRSN